MKRILRRFGIGVSALFIIGLGVGVAWLMSVGTSILPLKQYFSRSYTNAIWDWSSPTNKTSTQLSDLAKFLYLHQINTVYVDTNLYASFDPQNTSITQNALSRDALDTAFEQYITALSAHGVKIFAAAGEPDWSNRENWQKSDAILANVERYNEAHPSAKFDGVEFDIEAYNQHGFSEGSSTVKELLLGDYLDMVDHLVSQVSDYQKQPSHALEIGFAIPYWFDNENGNIPSITRNKQTGPTLFHLLDRLNSLPASNVVVMAYRNAAGGNDGVIAHARTEVDYATARAPHVKVIIGQEVNNVEPAKITYYSKSTTELSSQVRLVEDEFKSSSAFGGIAINDLGGYTNLHSN